jgi:hypothetical protein
MFQWWPSTHFNQSKIMHHETCPWNKNLETYHPSKHVKFQQCYPMCISMSEELEPSKYVTFQELCFSPIHPFSMFPHAIPICAQLPIHHALNLFQLSYTSSYFHWIILSRQLMKVME